MRQETELRKVLEKGMELLNREPEILVRIKADQDAEAKKEKKKRLEDKRYVDRMTHWLPGMEEEREVEIDANELMLERGRPRMEPEVVFVFLLLRGYWRSVSTKDAIERMLDSDTLRVYLYQRGIKLPGNSTIIENLNDISNETRNFILDAQLLRMVLEEGLDDFAREYLDSTHVKANSDWPTDAGILLGLLSRAFHLSQKLKEYGGEDFAPWWMTDWLKKLKKLLFQINVTGGKSNSKGRLKALYRKFLKTAQKAHDHLLAEGVRLKETKTNPNLLPSKQNRLDKIWGAIELDLFDAFKVLYYTEDRIMNGVVLKASKKVLSLSDGAAAFIIKGQREGVIGYRPQLGRSGNGFVTGLIVPQGNRGDSEHLKLLVEDIVKRTGVVPSLVSVDDGYSSKAGLEALEEMGVHIVSISGSKGKKITPAEKYESEAYKAARCERSSVESLIFTLKHSFEFDHLRRRGLEEVRAELLEKVIAYNFCRMLHVEEQRFDPELDFRKVA